MSNNLSGNSKKPADRYVHSIFFLLSILLITIDYQLISNLPIYSSLNCEKVFLNRTNCQRQESSLLNSNLFFKSIKNIHKVKIAPGSRNGIILLKIEIPIFGGSVKNIYYPSNIGVLGSLFISNNKALQEVNSINKFISKSKQGQTINLQRKISIYSLPLVFIMIGVLLISNIFIILFVIYTILLMSN